MELNEIRPKIDALNQQLLALFEERMALCREVALYKEEHQMPILVPERENAIFQWVEKTANPTLRPYDMMFFQTMLRLSRDYQNACLGRNPEQIEPGSNPWISTERLLLVPLEEKDMVPVFSLTSNPAIARYMKFSPHTELKQARELIQEYTQGNSYGCKVLDGKTFEFIGVFALKVDSEQPDRATISAFLGQEHQGKGYLTELLKMVRSLAHKLTGCSSLWAYIVSSNQPSVKAVQKAGFQLDSTLTFPDLPDSLQVYRLEL